MQRFFYRVDDGLVAGAAAVVAGDVRADLLAIGLCAGAEQILSGHQHAGRAEAALQRVALVEGLLQRRELLGIREAFDRFDRAAIGLHGEHQAAAHDLAVDAHGARATHAVLAADVRAGEAELIAQKVDQMLPRGDAASQASAVDRQCGFDSVFHARESSTLAKWSLVADEWYRSAGGLRSRPSTSSAAS